MQAMGGSQQSIPRWALENPVAQSFIIASFAENATQLQANSILLTIAQRNWIVRLLAFQYR
jgi:hypothetical protein